MDIISSTNAMHSSIKSPIVIPSIILFISSFNQYYSLKIKRRKN